MFSMDASTVAAVTVITILGIGQVNGDVRVKDLTTNRTINIYPDMQASFGRDFPTDGLLGCLVYASPDPQACSPVHKPPINETKCNETGYILLVARGGICEFSDKVLNGQEHGYSSVIVYNFVHNEEVFAMGGGINGTRVLIPSTFVGYTSGMALWKYNYTHRRYLINIIEDDPELKLFLWPFAVVIGVCFLIFMVFMLVKLGREHASKQLNRLSRKHLKKIPVRKFKKGDYYDTCAICLDEYEEGEKIRVLPCDHVYHMKCIDPWLTKNKKTCPVCKRRVIPGKDGDSESETEGAQTPAEDSETSPLLANSGQSRPQSHGSIAEPGVSLNSEGSVVQDRSQGNSISSSVNGSTVDFYGDDLVNGAVGGEGISDRQQTLLTLAASNAGNIQDPDDSHSEKKRKRKDGRRAGESEDPAGSSSLGSESRAEHKERRRLRKERKKQKEECRQTKQGSEETGPERKECNNEVDGRNAVQQMEGSVTDLISAETTTADVQTRGGNGFGYDNPSYSDSTETIVTPGTTQRRELNNVI